MKYIKILFFIGLSLNLYSQQTENQFKIKYDMYLYFENKPSYNSTLFINNYISKFEYSNKDKEDLEVINDNNVNIIIADTTKYTIITNLRNNNRYYFNSSDSNNIIAANIEKLNWHIIKDTVKIIGNHNCNFASTVFRGRKYYVWFASDINTGFGPWKLNGLPGLIIEAIDETKEVAFYLESIESYPNIIEEIDFSDKKIFTEAEYKIKFEKKIEDLVSKIKSKVSRGDNVKVEINVAKKKLEY